MLKILSAAKRHLYATIALIATTIAGAGGGAYLMHESAVPASAAMTQSIGSKVVTEFTIGGGRSLGPKGVLLNEGQYPNQTATIFVPSNAKGFDAVKDVKAVSGRTVLIRGVVAKYQDRSEVRATEVTVR